MAEESLTVAVVADTHVPDRVGALHPRLVSTLQEMQPNLILHAGDICAPGVLDTLRQVAPVEAVRGNRDWVFARVLPAVCTLNLNGVQVTLLHGHGNLRDYVVDKWHYLRQGYRYERYAHVVRKSAGDARVIVFGHTHHPECRWEGDVLMFNPGSASLGPNRNGYPSFGILNISEDGGVEGAVHFLGELKWMGKGWSSFR